MKKSCLTLSLSIIALLMGQTAGAQNAATQKDLLAELKATSHKIVFEAYENDNWDLFVMNADGTGRRNLTRTPQEHEMYPQCSPDGTKICFLRDVGSGRNTQRSVFVMNIDGTNRTEVASAARQPTWSYDSRRIAFVKQEFKRFNIADYASKGLFIYDMKTGKTTEIANEKVHHIYGLSWTPDGKWIVTTVHGGMGYDHAILAIEVAGTKVHDLKISGCRPCVSPDGKRITWSKNDHTVSVASLSLASEGAKVSDVRVLYHHKTMHLYHPDFSPDGKFITFSLGPGGRVKANGPGTHSQVAEMVGVRGIWDLYLRRSIATGPVTRLTLNPKLANKESDWLSVPAKKELSNK